MSEFLEDIKTLKAKLYSGEACMEFYSKYNFDYILNEYQDEKKYTNSQIMNIIDLIKGLLYNKKLFFSFFFEEKPIGTIMKLFTLNDSNVLPIISGSIFVNNKVVFEKIRELQNNKTQENVDEIIGILFYFLQDQETNVSFNITKTFREFIKYENCLDFFSEEQFLIGLEKILKSKNSTIRLRGLEITKDITKNDLISELMKTKQIIDLSLFLYEKSQNDILEKLAIIEILKDWCENKNVLKTLGNQKMFKLLKKDSLEAEDDLYLKRDLVVISLQLFNNFIVEYDKKFINDIYKTAKKFLGGYPEEQNAGLEICLHLFIPIENFEILLRDKEFIHKIKNLENSKDYFKIKYYDFLSNLLTMKRVSLVKKEHCYLSEKLFVNLLVLIFTDDFLQYKYIGDKQKIFAIENLLKKCYIPFQDIELRHLRILRTLLNYNGIFVNLFMIKDVNQVMVYLRTKTLNNQKVNELKKSCIEILFAKIDMLRKVSPELDKFVDELLKNKNKTIQEENNEMITEAG